MAMGLRNAMAVLMTVTAGVFIGLFLAERDRVAGLNGRLKALRREIADKDALLRRSGDDTDALNEQLEALSRRLSEVTREAGLLRAELESTRASASAPAGAGNTVANGGEAGTDGGGEGDAGVGAGSGDRSAAAWAPALAGVMLERQRKVLRRIYRPLFARLRLDRVTQDAVEAALLERHMARKRLAVEQLRERRLEAAELAEATAGRVAELNQRLKALLGLERMAALNAYDATVDVRLEVERYRQRLPPWAGLTRDQEEALVAAFLEAGDVRPRVAGQAGDGGYAAMVPEREREAAQWAADVRTIAAEFLSIEQLEVLDQFLAE